MSFIETPRFPDTIAYGAIGGPEYRTEIAALDSGYEARNVSWAQSRPRYAIELPLPTADQRETLIAFFRAMKGRAHGFRLKDWSDYTVIRTNGRLGTGTSGTGVPTYQLGKYYAAGALTEVREIRKPVSGTAAIYRGGVLQTAGASAGNYALDSTTGIVTWVADSSNSVSAVTVGATTVVTLSGALSGLAIGGRLYLNGLMGTVSTSLNGLAHEITNISGAQYTLNTSTTGLAYTSGGTGYKYAQPTETLDWSGEFDVPVRFGADYLPLTLQTKVVFRTGSVELIGIRV